MQSENEYEVLFKPLAERQLGKLPREIRQSVISQIAALGKTPRPHGMVKVHAAPGHYRVRIRDWRIIYLINDKEKRVVIVKIGKRDDIYDRINDILLF